LKKILVIGNQCRLIFEAPLEGFPELIVGCRPDWLIKEPFIHSSTLLFENILADSPHNIPIGQELSYPLLAIS